MKFPIKTIKLKPGNIAQPENSLRKEFLEDLPYKLRNSVRGIDLALINEAIASIAEGNATINGKKPATRVERFIVITSYFNTARAPLQNIELDSVINNVNTKHSVAITWKNQSYTVNFPTSPSEN
ncbi:MAG TPA: hypothetical protein VK783_00365 [Bacteroidia bacterium]|jgi:hypothetical protein|nr:hypothetical protein [Bacteroidia bacterium]